MLFKIAHNARTRWLLALGALPVVSLAFAIRTWMAGALPPAAFLVWTAVSIALLAALVALARATSGSRYHALEAQLHPHFLFNTLNSIATLMHEDVDAADDMMAKLATLLRRTLNHNGAYEIPLREELEILEIYLDIQRTRFEDRLTTAVDADPAALDAMVPRLILQPLVENAVRHGISHRTTPGRVEVRAWRDNATLHMTVLNDGAGWNPRERSPDGVGLANTRARLAQHFPNRYRFDLREGGDGGALAEIAVPVKPCPSAR